MINKLKAIILSPLFIFGILALIILSFLIITTGFNVPPYYTDLILAQQIADAHGAIESVINPAYEKFNYTFKAFSFFFALCMVCALFKIWTFKDFIKCCSIQNKTFLSIWIYASYLLYAEIAHMAYMYDLHLYVYPMDGDSWSIPMLGGIVAFFLLGVVYYAFMHAWCLLIYKNKVSPKIKYATTAVLLCISLYCNIIGEFNTRYSLFYSTLLFFMTFVWIFVVISLSRLNLNEMDKPDKKNAEIQFNWFVFIILSILFSIICHLVPFLRGSFSLPLATAVILTFKSTNKINNVISTFISNVCSFFKKS